MVYQPGFYLFPKRTFLDMIFGSQVRDRLMTVRLSIATRETFCPSIPSCLMPRIGWDHKKHMYQNACRSMNMEIHTCGYRHILIYKYIYIYIYIYLCSIIIWYNDIMYVYIYMCVCSKQGAPPISTDVPVPLGEDMLRWRGLLHQQTPSCYCSSGD